jgi:chaperonin cofactor prefoldin
MISEIKKDKFIKIKNIQSVEKQMRKVKKEIRRLQPKVQKAADNYN